MNLPPTFSILITTKNRLPDLKITLAKLRPILDDERVECIICNDCSKDDTQAYLEINYPKIKFFNNKKSRGLIANRNLLLKSTKAKYAISLDDDAHFIGDNILNAIERHFAENHNCAIIACRIFWGKQKLSFKGTLEKPTRVQGFVGCGHIWNMKAWREVPAYPEWYIFYGEEEFVSYHLFKKGWQVHYVPAIFVQHRVDVKGRKIQNDYGQRLRRSLRAGWYNYIMFLPWSKIPRLFIYTLYVQFKSKVFKGDLKAAIAIVQALWDLAVHMPRLIYNSNRLTERELVDFKRLAPTKIYWQPKAKLNS